MTVKKLLFAGLMMGLAAGCASIERTSPGMMDGLDLVGGDKPAEQSICVRVNGFGLLYLVTGICGNIAYDAKTHEIEDGFLILQDKCNCSDCYRTLQAIANDRGKIVTNANMFNNSLPNQGITGWSDYIGWFIESEDVGCSAVLRSK